MHLLNAECSSSNADYLFSNADHPSSNADYLFSNADHPSSNADYLQTTEAQSICQQLLVPGVYRMPVMVAYRSLQNLYYIHHEVSLLLGKEVMDFLP